MGIFDSSIKVHPLRTTQKGELLRLAGVVSTERQALDDERKRRAVFVDRVQSGESGEELAREAGLPVAFGVDMSNVLWRWAGEHDAAINALEAQARGYQRQLEKLEARIAAPGDFDACEAYRKAREANDPDAFAATNQALLDRYGKAARELLKAGQHVLDAVDAQRAAARELAATARSLGLTDVAPAPEALAPGHEFGMLGRVAGEAHISVLGAINEPLASVTRATGPHAHHREPPSATRAYQKAGRG